MALKRGRGSLHQSGSSITLKDGGSDATTITHGGNSGAITVTLPDATDTLVGRATTDTLTNKTLTSPKINEDVALTATSSELNVLDGITASTEELNILDGVTASAEEINVLDGITASTAELNVLDGVFATTEEINYLSGVSGSIQTQLDSKVEGNSGTLTSAVLITPSILDESEEVYYNISPSILEESRTIKLPALTTDDTFVFQGHAQELTNKTIDAGSNTITGIADENVASNADLALSKLATVTASRALVSDSDGHITASDVTAAELALLDGLTASTSELNVLDGITASTSELNVLSGLTASTAELNVLDGITASTEELNILDGVTANASELNVLDGITASTLELNQLTGVEVGGTNSGDIVTIDDSQTLSAKTLTSPELDNPVVDGYLDINEESAPAAPSSGTVRVYAKDDSKLYYQDSDENEFQIADTASVLANPMDAEGDIIVGGTSGATTKLAKGDEGQFLQIVSGTVAWSNGLATTTQAGAVNRYQDITHYDLTDKYTNPITGLNDHFLYQIIGRYCHFQYYLDAGAGGCTGGEIELTLPVPALVVTSNIRAAGSGLFRPSSTYWYDAYAVFLAGSDKMKFYYRPHSGTGITAIEGATFTTTNGCLSIEGKYVINW